MQQRRPREPYEPPQIVRVKLVRGEMAVTGCKTSSSVTGPTVGCVRAGCKKAGS